jgi:hypothetical protein
MDTLKERIETEICEQCEYLGEFTQEGKETFTLYHCSRENLQLAFPHDDNEFGHHYAASGMDRDEDHPLRMAYDLAQEKGLISVQ